MLNARVLAIFDGLSVSLKETIEDWIRKPLLEDRMNWLVDGLMINGSMVSFDAHEFPSLVLRTMPRGLRVQRVVSRVLSSLENRFKIER